MKNTIIIGVLAITALALIALMSTGANTPTPNNTTPTEDVIAQATIYKSPSCDCCSGYAAHLRDEGYGVDVVPTRDMSVVKAEHGIPYEVESCHTMEIAGYVVEGHVPEVAVNKLITEQPDITGIGMAGMPSGSPGMPGPQNAPFVVYEINHNGTQGEVYMTISN